MQDQPEENKEKKKRKTGIEIYKATSINALGKGCHCDGGNLYLDKPCAGKAGKWIFRFKSPLTLKYRKMGLGSYPDVGLAAARKKASNARELLADRKDPLEERRREERERLKSLGVDFEEAAKRFIEAKHQDWKGGKKGLTYRNHLNQLKHHAFPLIGKRPVAGLTRDDMVAILKPLLDKKQARTVERLIEYFRCVFDYAKVKGWRDGDNPAEWRGNLDKLLPNPSRVAPKKNHYAVASEKMPALMQALMKSQGTASLVARFAILNASRSGEARGALWEEIDLEKAWWTIPAHRMKAGALHIVVLSRPAVALLKEVRPLSNGAGLIFPNSKGKPLSDVMILKAVKLAGRSIGEPDITLHGLRATFRTWVGDETNYQREIAEHALSHVVGGSNERAYSRGVMENKRRPLMEEWGRFCMGESK